MKKVSGQEVVGSYQTQARAIGTGGWGGLKEGMRS